MKHFDRIISIIFLAFAAIVIWQSVIIPMGHIGKPGPGFLPFWVAVIMALLSGVLWFQAGLRQPVSEEVKFLSGEGRWPSVVLTAAALLAYAFLMETLGFITSTLLLLLLLFRVIGRQKWWVALTGTVLVTWAAHTLFQLVLKVHLPSGLFRI
jgi:putative tricarboxylic transport membrane protein